MIASTDGVRAVRGDDQDARVDRHVLGEGQARCPAPGWLSGAQRQRPHRPPNLGRSAHQPIARDRHRRRIVAAGASAGRRPHATTRLTSRNHPALPHRPLQHLAYAPRPSTTRAAVVPTGLRNGVQIASPGVATRILAHRLIHSSERSRCYRSVASARAACIRGISAVERRRARMAPPPAATADQQHPARRAAPAPARRAAAAPRRRVAAARVPRRRCRAC